MALSDYNWGMIIIGAASVTALVAANIGTGAAPFAAAIMTGAAIAGGGLGQMASNFIGRMQDSAVALVHR